MAVLFLRRIWIFFIFCMLAACGNPSKQTRSGASSGGSNTNLPTPTPITEPPAAGQPPTTGTAAAPTFDRVLIIVMENQDAGAVMANAYYQGLASRGASFTAARGVAHPSYPNYLALIGGDIFGVTSNNQVTVPGKHIGDLLTAHGLDWRNYAEGYPGNCFLGDASGSYARKHVPFLSFETVQSVPAACAKVVSADQFQTDRAAGSLPAYALYSPDLNHDGHDTGLEAGAAWLEGFLDPLLADATFMKGTLVVVTFDESLPTNPNNPIFTVFLGPMVKTGVSSNTPYDHYTLLRTIEENFKVGTLDRKDAAAKPITDVWK